MSLVLPTLLIDVLDYDRCQVVFRDCPRLTTQVNYECGDAELPNRLTFLLVYTVGDYNLDENGLPFDLDDDVGDDIAKTSLQVHFFDGV